MSAATRLAAAEGLEPAGGLALSEIGDDRFEAWLERGFDGEMGYLRRYRDRRLRPLEFFQPYVAVMTFLAPYERTPASDDPQIGDIARYALGDDYHEVLKAKLRRVVESLQELDPDFEGRPLVDTAPILEKLAAARAGLGWQGKHSNLIRQDRGSWFFLAELLVNRPLPLPPAEASPNRCGTCVACIDVCPTQAIVEPYVVDARRCISYLTIELRGPIPHEFRPFIGNRIFGCDDCQAICPWNRFATESPIAEFRARPGLRNRTLTEWLKMSLEDWRVTFRRSAVKRAKYAGFKRNVAVALGCAADAATIPDIVKAYAKEDALVRSHLVWALGEMPDAAGLSALSELKVSESDETVCEEIELALTAANRA